MTAVQALFEAAGLTPVEPAPPSPRPPNTCVGPGGTRESAAAAERSARSSASVLARFDSPVSAPMHLYRAAIPQGAALFQRGSRGFRQRGGTGGSFRG